ncbi:hypothetical protein [Aeromonas enteropelogenes]|uniref:hypothetical protein n=1 Tax=Aeromonas enteropelogenes TaxID=29489 RepID=UPI003BA3B8B1
MTIRQSGFGSLEPTRQVTAQRYQASVAPAPRQLSGLEKLAEFGMQSLKYKHQIDQEVLQADLSIAVEKYEDAIKGMDPSDFAKDPEGGRDRRPLWSDREGPYRSSKRNPQED